MFCLIVAITVCTLQHAETLLSTSLLLILQIQIQTQIQTKDQRDMINFPCYGLPYSGISLKCGNCFKIQLISLESKHIIGIRRISVM